MEKIILKSFSWLEEGAYSANSSTSKKMVLVSDISVVNLIDWGGDC